MSTVALGQTQGLTCRSYLQSLDISVTGADILSSSEFSQNAQHHIKRILYSTYTESFPENFKRVQPALDSLKEDVDRIIEDTTRVDMMYLQFRMKKEVLKLIIEDVRDQFFKPRSQRLNLDIWYRQFNDLLSEKIDSERTKKPDDFFGTEGEWSNLLDSLFVPKAKFYPYAKKSLKRKVLSVVSDIRGHITYHRGRLVTKSLRRSPEFLALGALLYLGSFITVNGYAEIPPGGYQYSGQAMYDWLPLHAELHDFAKANDYWLYFTAPAIFNAYTLSYTPYLLMAPVSYTQHLLKRYRAHRSQSILAKSSQEMAEILSQHLSLNRLSARKISKAMRTPVKMETIDKVKKKINKGVLSWSEAEAIYRDIGQAIKYTSSSVSAFMLYETNPIKSYTSVLKGHLEYIKDNNLPLNTPLSLEEKRQIENERLRSLRIVDNINLLRGYVVGLIEALELLQGALPSYDSFDPRDIENLPDFLSSALERNNMDMATGVHVSILSLRQLLGGLENYQGALIKTSQELQAKSFLDESPVLLLEDLQTLDMFMHRDQVEEEKD